MPEDRNEAFIAHRGLVVRLAYDITGSWADAEDVASQVYLSWQAVDSEVTNHRAYLARMATHRALDVVSARDRVGYVGPWLPEPVLTAPGSDDAIELADEVEIALMVVLGALSPLERAAFLLHDVFAFTHVEVADMLGRDPAAVRQLASRARSHLEQRRTPREVTPGELSSLVATFLKAAQLGDLDALKNLLTDDVVFIGDGGGRVSTARRPVVGADNVGRFFIGVATKLDDTVRFQPVVANRRLGLAVWFGGALDQVLWLLLEDDRICQLLGVRNPEKLTTMEALLRDAQSTKAPLMLLDGLSSSPATSED